MSVLLAENTPHNGPLMLIPGSHRNGVLTDAEIHALARSGEIAECTGPRGSILAMRPLIVHASSKARSNEPRRVLHIEYADSLSLGNRIRLAEA